MSAYNTEQKKMLEEFMYKNRDNSFTIDEINEKISQEGGTSAPARSTAALSLYLPAAFQRRWLARCPRVWIQGISSIPRVRA